MIRFYSHVTLKAKFSGLCLTFLFLFITSACTSSEAELAQKVQTLSKEEKIAALHTEIQEAIHNNFNVDSHKWYLEHLPNNECITPHILQKESLLNVLNVLITSPHSTDLATDELLTILRTETGFPIRRILRPETDLKPDHIIIGFRHCRSNPRLGGTYTSLYLLDRAGYVESLKGGGVGGFWTFPDGEAVLTTLRLSTSGVDTAQAVLYRTYNDGHRWQSAELILDPEPYLYADKPLHLTFDEDGKQITAYIPSYGVQPPCEFTQEFISSDYNVVTNWDVTLSYAFDNGAFTLVGRQDGVWTIASHEGERRIRTTKETAEWRQFCVDGTLRPVLP